MSRTNINFKIGDNKMKVQNYDSKKDKAHLENNYVSLEKTSEEQNNILSYFAKFLVSEGKILGRSMWNDELKKDLLEIMCKSTLSNSKYIDKSGIFSIGKNGDISRKKSNKPNTQSAFVMGDQLLINSLFYTDGKMTEIKKTCNPELYKHAQFLSKWWSDKKSNLLTTFENRLRNYLKDLERANSDNVKKDKKEKFEDLNPLQSIFYQIFGKDVLNPKKKHNKNALNLKMFNNTSDGYKVEIFDECFYDAMEKYAERTNIDLVEQGISKDMIVKYKNS